MASPLEHYVNHVRTMSSAGNFRELVEYLLESTELLAKNGNILDNVLETLDIQQHSLGVLFVLVIKFSEPNNHDDTENVLRVVREFITLCNGEQVRFATQPYFELCHQFTSALVKNKQYTIQGIQVLALAVEKIRMFDTQLTPVHADLCQLCLCAKVFSPALRFLDTDVTAIANTEDSNHDTKYFLLYYYYGGMLYTAVKNYERARFMKPLSHAYHDLSSAYNSTNSDEVRNVVNKYRDSFLRDTNMGLVKQVVSSLYKKNIQRLTKTFLTLSLADVASRVQLSGPAEAERYILNMIKSGEIFASINQKDGMVVFKDDPEKYDSPVMFHKVQQEITRVMGLNKQILKMEEDIMLNPVYVKKSMGNQEDDVIGGQHSKSYSGDPTE